MSDTHDRSATRLRPPESPCLNCGDDTPGRYCPTCGQRKTEVLVSVRTLLADVLEDQLVLNRALPRTIGALLFHPGFLTAEYVRGRIVRYIAPFRLYLVSSVLFFLILSFVGIDRLNTDFAVNDSGTAALSGDSAAAAALDSVARALRGARDTTGLPDSARSAIAAEIERASRAMAQSDSTAPSAALDAITGSVALPPGTMQPWARSITMEGGNPVLRAAFRRKVEQVGHLPLREAVREVLRDLLEYAPHMVFVLLPIFALLLKLLYARRGRFYAEHFVFALHVHAFVFVMFTIMFLLPWGRLDLLLLGWIVIYLWLALKRVYRQGWVRTTLKWWTLGWLYAWALLFGLLGLGVVTLLLT